METERMALSHDQGRGLPGDSGDTINFGVGIRSMQERLREFGGSLQIESNGAVHKQPEGKEPQTPKYFGDTKSVIMQIEEQHSQSIPLRLFEYG
jgi:glucose-6-phosphate-specific signal transduction histidine kinase